MHCISSLVKSDFLKPMLKIMIKIIYSFLFFVLYNFFVFNFVYGQNVENCSESVAVDSIYPVEKGVYLVKEGMPANTRHLAEGYWIGAMPNINNIDSMKNHGIKVILTVTRTKKEWNPVKEKIQALGIKHIYIPVGSRFPDNSSFYDDLMEYEPNEIFVHCEHGGDRSGAFIAYLLVRRNKWTPQRALLAMMNPNRADINGLKVILKRYNLDVTEEDTFITSIYSGASNNGFGGLKVRGDSYVRLVSSMLENLKNDSYN